MSYHQIEMRAGRVERVPLGEVPVIGMELEPHQRLVSFEATPAPLKANRRTVDWRWHAVIDHDLGEPA